MEHAIFGKTGFNAVRLGFGGAVAGLKNYLQKYDPADAQDARNIRNALNRALEKGINYFDTAAGYGGGASERLFGDVLGDVDPSTLFLATKCGPCDADTLHKSVEKSLKNLRRDYIDLLQIHGSSYSDDSAQAILATGGMLEAMEQLKRDGVIRFTGFTSEDTNGAVFDFIRSGRFDQMQICYNLLFQHPYDPSRSFGSLPEAKKAGMATVSMRTATSGTFQKWNKMVRPDDTFDYTRALIQFTLSNPYIDVVLVGMRNASEVDVNIDILEDLAGRIDLKVLHERYV